MITYMELPSCSTHLKERQNVPWATVFPARSLYTKTVRWDSGTDWLCERERQRTTTKWEWKGFLSLDTSGTNLTLFTSKLWIFLARDENIRGDWAALEMTRGELNCIWSSKGRQKERNIYGPKGLQQAQMSSFYLPIQKFEDLFPALLLLPRPLALLLLLSQPAAGSCGSFTAIFKWFPSPLRLEWWIYGVFCYAGILPALNPCVSRKNCKRFCNVFNLLQWLVNGPGLKGLTYPCPVRACMHEDGLIGNFSGECKHLDFYIIKRIGYIREGPGHRYERTGMTTLKDCGK